MAARPKTQRARRLRRDATDAERLLWRGLKEMNLPVRIRRQHPVGRYIVDFAVPSRKLAIEVDGGQHALDADKDARRTRALRKKGYRVLRFWNNEIVDNLDGVLTAIRAALDR